MADSVYNSEHSGRALTIAHVAQSAGVSSTTASLGLRDDPRVKAATRKRILAAAAKLGYRTNAAARALASIAASTAARAGRAPTAGSPARGLPRLASTRSTPLSS